MTRNLILDVPKDILDILCLCLKVIVKTTRQYRFQYIIILLVIFRFRRISIEF